MAGVTLWAVDRRSSLVPALHRRSHDWRMREDVAWRGSQSRDDVVGGGEVLYRRCRYAPCPRAIGAVTQVRDLCESTCKYPYGRKWTKLSDAGRASLLVPMPADSCKLCQADKIRWRVY